MSEKRYPSPDPSPRWWPAVLIVLVAGARLAWLASRAEESLNRQSVVMSAGATILLAGVALLVWLAFFSGLGRKARRWIFGVLAAGTGVFFGLFRYAGVSGDLVPVFEYRWGGLSDVVRDESLDEPTTTGDFPQFRGPNRDGTLVGVRLARDWESEPPRLVWRRPVGKGWSSFAIAGRHAVTLEQHGDQERVASYDLATGERRWHGGEDAGYSNPVAGDGPRTTPTIVDGRVYTMGGTGILSARRLENGERLWSRDVPEDHDARVPEWGFSCSPLVIDGVVVVCTGDGPRGSLAAYDARTGELVWRGGTDPRAGYASPAVATLRGARQILMLNGESVSGHDPSGGSLLWSHDWPSRQPNVAQPVTVPGDGVVVSAGYGVGSKRFDIEPGGNGLRARLVWENVRLKAKFANVIFYDGYLYGLDDGILVCLDPATGERRWKRGRYGHGQMLLVGDSLLVQTEQGEIVLVEPNPEALIERARFRVVDGKIWNAPALAAPYLLVRNDREAALFELPLE